MKKLVILVLVFTVLFSPIQLAKANIQPKLKTGDVLSVQVNRLYGGSRLFKESDGYEEVIINKVVKWINTSSHSEGATELELNKTPIVSILKIKMKNGDVAVIEPAYNCISENQAKTCTIAESEVIYTRNNIKIRLKSLELYDWLLVGWKYESVGAPKDELLEETLYTRYFSYLDKTYSDFIMCPKIDKIERINGDENRHIVHASALNYVAHHGDVPYDRIHITLTDTPEHGVKINKVKIQKSISGKESRIQCRRES
ncbi:MULTISPECIES: hypothetical protein [unclassified Peribacillus]|uniref:hypothetical protein n=1 Tax=unclassified Peribacillus TaxID=2675266 RepID=UPI001912B44B|nr:MULTISPECIES: hypothetical protein [unclassified Peribacillus]MBK5446954.1 hypothetical protein [Peribacillus sp. TH24]MBK5458195.1 hypothetical protein [Peribacillus sp. TH27]